MAKLVKRHHPSLCFDVSMTVQSVFNSKSSNSEHEQRFAQLHILKAAGLRKVFLGIESGSPSQLKRYAKGHSSEEGAEAVRILRELDIEVELGFIMFDPLCTLREIEENIHFLAHNGMLAFVSSLTNELRLQVGSRYLAMLEQVERKLGITLYNRDLDGNTLSFSYDYLNPNVATLASKVREWNARLRPLQYPLKNLSRFGPTGALGSSAMSVRELLRKTKLTYAQRLLDTIKCIQAQGHINKQVEQAFDRDIRYLATVILEIFGNGQSFLPEHQILDRLLKNAAEVKSWN